MDRDNKNYIETYETLQGAKDLATTQGHFVKNHTKLEAPVTVSKFFREYFCDWNY